MKFSAVPTLLVVLLCEVNHSTSTIDDDRHPGFLFDNNPGYILSLPIRVTNVQQMTTTASNKMNCVFDCVGMPWCRSVNFKITPEKDDRHICELIAADNYTNPKSLTPKDKYIHLSIKNPCETKPCLNKGKCIPHKNRLDYRCKCKKGYTGANCQTDIDECVSIPSSCHQNAVCSNTAGSYNCTCNRGYYGNGLQCTPYSHGLEFSAILRSYGNADYLWTLSAYLHPVLQNPSQSLWVRCWRASSDGWNTETTFHPQCDGKGPSVTIVRVGSYVFGGYTDVSWHSRDAYSSSNRSFLYSLYNTRGYQPGKLTLRSYPRSDTIYGRTNYGPTFGGGHDIYISNYATSNSNSYTNVGHTYCAPTRCSNGGGHCTVLAGNHKFSPNDIEVFYETIN